MSPVVARPWLPISLTHICSTKSLSPSSLLSSLTFHPHHVDVGPDDPVDSSDSVTHDRL